MQVKELKRISDERNKGFVTIFNPDTKDFTALHVGRSYTIPFGESRKFRYLTGMHLAKHLANRMLMDKKIRFDKEPERSELLKRILI